jgi:hypothetical protein
MVMGKHTATYPGKMVRVVFRDGSSADGRFVTRTPNGTLVLDGGRRYPRRAVLRLLLLRGGKTRPGD